MGPFRCKNITSRLFMLVTDNVRVAGVGIAAIRTQQNPASSVRKSSAIVEQDTSTGRRAGGLWPELLGSLQLSFKDCPDNSSRNQDGYEQ